MDDFGNQLEDGRREATADWRHAVDKSLADAKKLFEILQLQANRTSEAVKKIEQEVRVNSAMTKETRDNSGELLEVFRALKGGFVVLGWLGSAAKWIGIVGGGGSVIWKIIHGQWPFK